MKNKKFIIDTDIGDDIDDAFALSLAKDMPGAELIGVTTVFRNTQKRAQQASKMLAAMGMSGIPVIAGERLPYKEPIHVFDNDSDEKPEDCAPCQWSEEYQSHEVKEGAVDFIIEQAKKYGEDLIIVPVGPLTNVARAIEKDKAAMSKVGKIVSMGGSFNNTSFGEWNVYCDPEAAAIVYSSGIPFYAVGLDVTLQCTLEEGLLDEVRANGSERNALLALWLDRWFKHFNFEKSVMHDPLALISCFYQDVCTFSKKWVRIDLQSVRGATLSGAPGEEGYSPVYVATEVNKQKFYDLIREKIIIN